MPALEVHGIVTEASAPYLSQHCHSSSTVKARGYSLREHWEVPLAAKDCDLLHATHYNVPLFYSGPLVVSIHDLNHLTQEGCGGRGSVWMYAWAMFRIAARRARHVITVSEYSKSCIVERLKIPDSKVTVIPHGVSPGFVGIDKNEARVAALRQWSGKNPYFLCVCSLRPHKNLARLLQAASLFWQQTQINWDLVVVGDGKKSERDRLSAACQRLGIGSKVFFVQFVEEARLRNLYRGAEFVVMPSLAEGFGFPVLEAMASGTPVACSRTTSLPEVGGDAPSYFDPLSPEDIARAMEVILNEREASRMRTRGLERAATFTWERSAQEHYEVYCRVIHN